MIDLEITSFLHLRHSVHQDDNLIHWGYRRFDHDHETASSHDHGMDMDLQDSGVFNESENHDQLEYHEGFEDYGGFDENLDDSISSSLEENNDNQGFRYHHCEGNCFPSET